MRFIVALTVIAGAALFVAPQANAATTTWCALDGTYDCIYSSLQQCLEGVNSTNAICEPSNFAEDQQVLNPRVRRQASKH